MRVRGWPGVRGGVERLERVARQPGRPHERGDVGGERRRTVAPSRRRATGPTSSLTWTHPNDDLITEVRIVGNGANANPQFRRNFGFRSLTVRVLDADGGVVLTEDHDLPGTPDPDVVVTAHARGRTVEVVFTGLESPACAASPSSSSPPGANVPARQAARWALRSMASAPAPSISSTCGAAGRAGPSRYMPGAATTPPSWRIRPLRSSTGTSSHE